MEHLVFQVITYIFHLRWPRGQSLGLLTPGNPHTWQWNFCGFFSHISSFDCFLASRSSAKRVSRRAFASSPRALRSSIIVFLAFSSAYFCRSCTAFNFLDASLAAALLASMDCSDLTASCRSWNRG